MPKTRKLSVRCVEGSYDVMGEIIPMRAIMPIATCYSKEDAVLLCNADEMKALIEKLYNLQGQYLAIHDPSPLMRELGQLSDEANGLLGHIDAMNEKEPQWKTV